MAISPRMTLLTIAFLAACALPAAAQGPAAGADEIAQLRAELASLRAEVDALRRVVTDQGRAASQSPAQPDPRIDMLQTQVAELAQTKVESTSRFPVKVFGAVHTHAFANSGTPNWLDVPNLVQPTPSDGRAGTF